MTVGMLRKFLEGYDDETTVTMFVTRDDSWEEDIAIENVFGLKDVYGETKILIVPE